MSFSTERLRLLPILLPVMLLSMMAHELMHAYVAYRMGDPTAKMRGRLSLNPLKHLDPVGTAVFVYTILFTNFIFGWAKPVPISPYRFKNRQRGMGIVGAAGPITNFVIAIIFIVILNAVQPDPASWVAELFFLMFQINLVLGLFNLIPIPPLDGSRILGAFLPRGAYDRWAALDQYGWIFFIAILILFRGPFFQALGWAIRGIANLLSWHFIF